MPKKILLIEDEALQVLLLETQLRESGFEVAIAMNGEEGLRKAIEEKPDLILLDVILPGLSGIEICLRLQESLQMEEIPVLLVTASEMRGLQERYRRFGVQGVLVKPYQFSELLEKIQTCLSAQEKVLKPQES